MIALRKKKDDIFFFSFVWTPEPWWHIFHLLVECTVKILYKYFKIAILNISAMMIWTCPIVYIYGLILETVYYLKSWKLNLHGKNSNLMTIIFQKE